MNPNQSVDSIQVPKLTESQTKCVQLVEKFLHESNNTFKIHGKGGCGQSFKVVCGQKQPQCVMDPSHLKTVHKCQGANYENITIQSEQEQHVPSKSTCADIGDGATPHGLLDIPNGQP